MQKQDWLSKNEYPFESKFFLIDGYKLHYIDEGSGDVLLFVHGTPTWSFDYRNLIKHFSKNYRCIAIDHIGFGLSDKPYNYNYSTPKHSSNLEKFIDKLELQNITLVVHDFGGPIGLNYAVNNQENIKQLIIFNTWLWSIKEEPEFKSLSKILKSPFLPFLYKYLNFSAKYLIPASYYNKQSLSKQIHTHYINTFSNSKERNGTIAFAKSLLNDQDWFQEIWNKINSIHKKRTLFIWGMSDKFISVQYLNKFEDNFTNSETNKLENTGHFPFEEQKVEVIKIIEEWLL